MKSQQEIKAESEFPTKRGKRDTTLDPYSLVPRPFFSYYINVEKKARGRD